MKLALAVAALLACALAAPVDDKGANVVSFTNDIRPDGSFDSGYETSNGIAAQESGALKEGHDEENKPLLFVVRQGRYSFVDSDGKSHEITWTADENGYNAQGADIPVAPQA